MNGRPAAAALCAALVILCAPRAAAASTFEDYRARVERASRTVEYLLAARSDEDAAGAGDEELAAVESRQAAEVLRALPERERVEWEGGATEVDNGWLHKELEGLVALPARSAGERRRVLARVTERLGELRKRLEEAGAGAQSRRDKEAEKGRLQSILSRPEYNEKAARGGALQAIRDWLARLFGRRARREEPEEAPGSPAAAGLIVLLARVVVFGLAAAVIVFVVWRYGPWLLSRVGTRRRKERAREARVVLGERIEADRSAADLIDEAERLARAGDVRGAIRKAYVAVLCELGDRKLISLARHKTNRDYLNSLRERAPLYEMMRPLTQGFELHWYGLAPATDSDWDAYRSLCREALR